MRHAFRWPLVALTLAILVIGSIFCAYQFFFGGGTHLVVDGIRVEAMVFLDNEKLIWGKADGAISVWNTHHCWSSTRFIGHSKQATALAISPDHSLLASGSADWTIRVWDLNTGKSLSVLQESACVKSIAFVDAGGTMLASATCDGGLRVWDCPRQVLLRSVTLGKPIDNAVLSPNTKSFLVCATDELPIKSWNVLDNCLHPVGIDLKASPSSISISPDESLLITAHAKAAHVWDWPSVKWCRSFDKHNDYITAVAFSPDSSRVATGSMDGTVFLWDVRDGRCVHSYPSLGGGISCLMFSPSGSVLAAGVDFHVDRGMAVSTSIRLLPIDQQKFAEAR